MPGTLGVLVAGGAGTRLGLGLPKALVRVGGATLLERGLRTLETACDEIVVAAPASLALPLPNGSRGGLSPTPVADVEGAAGPLAGVVAGFSSRTFARAVVLGVDFPCVTSAALESLLARLGDRGAVVPAPGGVPQPLVAAYAPATRAILAARLVAGERSLRRALEALDVLRLEDDALARLPGGLESFLNLNTRGDLADAERRLAAR
jgi:molybdopterin-guanine dinucleotide biosynthesis protein A